MAALPWRLKKYTSSGWNDTELRRWNGSTFVTTNMYYWDGASWVLCTDRTPPTTTQTKSYASIWARSYGFHGASVRGDVSGANNNYQGDYAGGSGTYGIQASSWGLPGTVHTDIDGAVAYYYAQAYLNNTHTWKAAGGTAVIGTHQNTGPPPSLNANRLGVLSAHFTYGQEKWVNLGTQFCQWADDNTMYGLVLYINSGDTEYYGYWTTSIVYEHSFEK